MFIHKDDLKNYTLSTEFQEKLITPRKALFEKIVADVNLDKEKRIRLAKAKAKAIKLKLSLGQLAAVEDFYNLKNKFDGSVRESLKSLAVRWRSRRPPCPMLRLCPPAD